MPSWCCRPSPDSVVRPEVPPSKKPARAHIRGSPDEIGDALEAEHGVVNEKRNGVDAVRGIRGTGGDKGRHRTRLGDSLFQNLPVLGFLVVQQRIHVDRFVFLSDAGINADGAEQRFHTKGSRFIGHDGHNELADFRILQHFAEHGDECHGGGNFAPVAAVVEFAEQFIVIRHERLRTHFALRNITAKRFPACA